jgi:hypothetical protein
MVRPAALVLVPLSVVVLALSACAVEPKEWTATVCSAMTPWRKQIADLNGKAQKQMASAKTATQTQDNLVTLLHGGEEASEKARKAIENAGEPDVDHGDQIAKQFTDSLAAIRDAYGHAGRAIGALPTKDDDTFYDGVVDVITRLNQEYAAGVLDVTKLESAELRRSFDENPACQ